MSASSRANQIAGHLNFPKGLLAGQVAVITGSGQGIGAECARLFANEGARVVVADVDADGEVVGELAVVAGADCGSWPKLVLRPQPYSRQLVTWLEEHRAGTEDNPGGCGPRWSNCSWSGGGQPAWLAPGLQVVAVAAG